MPQLPRWVPHTLVSRALHGYAGEELVERVLLQEAGTVAAAAVEKREAAAATKAQSHIRLALARKQLRRSIAAATRIQSCAVSAGSSRRRSP